LASNSKQINSQKPKRLKIAKSDKRVKIPFSAHSKGGIKNFLNFIFPPRYSGFAEKLLTKLAKKKITGKGKIIKKRFFLFKSDFFNLTN